MKIRKKKKKQGRLSIRHQLRWLKNGVLNMFLVHHRMIQLAIVTIGAIGSLVVAAYVLFSPVEVQSLPQTPTAQLKTEIVDELELFIELRNTAYENPPPVSPQTFGR